MSAPLSPERCACGATTTDAPAAAEHEKWCAWVKPTAGRIAEIKAGSGPVMLAGELKWLAGDASRAELHISGAAAGAFPLSDDLPGLVAELGRKLGAAVAELDRTRTALEQSENDLTGARLDLWEEEQDTRRLRLALTSARRGRAAAREEVEQLRADAVRLQEIADREHKAFIDTHNALNLLHEDANRVMAENGVQAQQAELERVREQAAKFKGQRGEWAKRARIAEASVAELLAERHSTNEALDDAVTALRTTADAAAEHEFAVEAGHAAPDRVLPWLADLDPGDVQDLASALATATVGWQREPEIVLARVEWALEEIRARVAGGGETA